MKAKNLKQVQVKYKEENVHRHIELTAVSLTRRDKKESNRIESRLFGMNKRLAFVYKKARKSRP